MTMEPDQALNSAAAVLEDQVASRIEFNRASAPLIHLVLL